MKFWSELSAVEFFAVYGLASFFWEEFVMRVKSSTFSKPKKVALIITLITTPIIIVIIIFIFNNILIYLATAAGVITFYDTLIQPV